MKWQILAYLLPLVQAVSEEWKGAFLFLSRGPMPLDEIWHEFFTWRAHPSEYSIYVHAHMGYEYESKSVFYQKEIPHHGESDWGGMSQVRAIRKLVRHALEDPSNQWFFLMSESCIPLKPFSLWKRAFSGSNRSIINGCYDDPKNSEIGWRWRPSLESIGFKKEHWRKSGTWFALKRSHAEIFAVDKSMDSAWEGVPCVDEHYLPSLLARHGLDNETTCSDGFVHHYFPGIAAHPHTYPGHEIRPELFEYLQKPIGTSSFAERCSNYTEACHFTARKFAPSAKYALLANMHFLLDDNDVPYTGNAIRWLNLSLKSNADKSKYYLLENGHLREFLNSSTAVQMGLNLSMATLLTESEMQTSKFGAPFLERPEGKLIRLHRGKEIFLVEHGLRRGFYSWDAFVRSGHDMSEVVEIAEIDMDQIPIGEPIY